jgi:hypothetical protein
MTSWWDMPNPDLLCSADVWAEKEMNHVEALVDETLTPAVTKEASSAGLLDVHCGLELRPSLRVLDARRHRRHRHGSALMLQLRTVVVNGHYTVTNPI